MNGRWKAHSGRTGSIWGALLVVMAALAPHDALAQGARLQLDDLNRLQTRASETVNVTIDPSMLKLALGFLSADKTTDASVRELMASIKGIYVRSFEFDRDGAYSAGDVKSVRDQLSSRGWSKVISTESQQDMEVVEIYSWRDSGDPGLAILVLEPREVTVVNILGQLDLARLRALEGQFGIPKLP